MYYFDQYLQYEARILNKFLCSIWPKVKMNKPKEIQIAIKMASDIQKQYQITSKIGNGNFSTVYLAKHISSQQIVAVKTMKNHIPIAIKEAKILKKMNHPNIIKLHQFQKHRHKQQVMIVLEYVPQNILELYEAQQYGLKEQQVKCILFQSCMGLYHIHKKGIIHRDIKPQNIMINRNKAEVKIIDFGLAIQQDKCCTDYVATRWYRAPENLLGTKQYTVAIDIFSLGCVIVQLYLGSPLFPGANNIDQISKILSMIEQPTTHSWRKGYQMLNKLGLSFNSKSDKKKVTLKTLLSSCSQNLSKIIEKMLILSPFKRITAQEILKDPYFRDIEKIIPPYVYDRYLADFKTINKLTTIRDLPKPEKRNQSKQRVRFLSEQKGFGAFTSFKSHTTLNNFRTQLSRQQQTNQQGKINSNKIISFQKTKQDYGTCDQNNLQTTVLTKSRKSSFIKNQIIKEVAPYSQQNSATEITDLSSSIKKQIQKYEKNILKLSTSLKNIKLLKSATELQTQKNESSDQAQQKSDQLKKIKSTQMLRFRGFNQPKQKISIKQTGSTFFKKNLQMNQQKLESFPIKNKKVMEYLQKFQPVAYQSQQLQRQKLQNSRSQPTIYQSVNGTLKKPNLLINTEATSFGEKQHQNQHELMNSTFHMNPIENISFYHNQSSSNLLSQSFQRNHVQMKQSQKIRSAQMLYCVSPQSQLRKSFEWQKAPAFQSPQRYSVQQPTIKFAIFNRDPEGKNRIIPVQKSIQSSRAILQEPQKMLINSARSGQVVITEPNSLNSTNYLKSSRNLVNSPEMNINPNRPIQKKIKLIAARDNLPPTNSHDTSQTLLTSSFSSVNNSRNLSYYQSKSSFMDKTRPDLGTQQTLQSLEKVAQQMRTPQQLYPSEYELKQNLMVENQQKIKRFKSLEHRQFYSKKTPLTRYSINPSEEGPNIGYPKNYPSPNQPPIDNEFKPAQQKYHQTTLSQLRESITGLSPSLNEGAYFSQRSQKSSNKNININLNLNICKKHSPKKR